MCENCNKILEQVDPNTLAKLMEHAQPFIDAMKEIDADFGTEEISGIGAILTGAILTGYAANMVDEGNGPKIYVALYHALESGHRIGWAVKHRKVS